MKCLVSNSACSAPENLCDTCLNYWSQTQADLISSDPMWQSTMRDKPDIGFSQSQLNTGQSQPPSPPSSPTCTDSERSEMERTPMNTGKFLRSHPGRYLFGKSSPSSPTPLMPNQPALKRRRVTASKTIPVFPEPDSNSVLDQLSEHLSQIGNESGSSQSTDQSWKSQQVSVYKYFLSN